MNGNIKIEDMFNAGLNYIFWDMYHPFEKCKETAIKSGYDWFYQDDKNRDCFSVFRYQNNPNIHKIMLAESPYHWAKKKIGRGYLQTFFNDLDWPAAKEFGIEPVIEPPKRRCDLPNKFVNVNYDGTYSFCCFDYLKHSIHNFDTVNEGLDGFIKFWLGQYMQSTRIHLYNNERIKHEYCAKCRFTSIRGDIPYWKPDLIKWYWNGKNWIQNTIEILPFVKKEKPIKPIILKTSEPVKHYKTLFNFLPK